MSEMLLNDPYTYTMGVYVTSAWYCIYLPPPVMLYCCYFSFTVMAISVWVFGIGTVHGLSSVRRRRRRRGNNGREIRGWNMTLVRIGQEVSKKRALRATKPMSLST